MAGRPIVAAGKTTGNRTPQLALDVDVLVAMRKVHGMMSDVNSRPRDQYRSSVYAVEDSLAALFDRSTDGTGTIEFFGSTLTIPIERKFASIDSIQTYADAVLALPWVRDRWPDVPPIHVRKRKGRQRAHYEPGRSVIAVPEANYFMRETVALHETAHHLVYHSAGSAVPVHGAEFTGILVGLYDRAIGPEAALLLRANLDGASVPVKPVV